MNFKGKVVLVTGGSRGIGRAIVEEFAKNGASVIFSYCNNEDISLKLCEEIKNKYFVSCLAIKCDISNEEEIKSMVDISIKEYGHIDILVNNAGIAIDTLYEDKTKENFMKTLEVNLVGPFLVSKYVGKYMLENKLGNIIFISSTNGIDTPYVESLDYDASKAGVISLVKNLANYYAPYIRVNSVAPGWINTDMNKELDEEFINRENNKILLNRFGEVSEIAKVVTFLASDDSSYVNGSIIRVDGGSKNG